MPSDIGLNGIATSENYNVIVRDIDNGVGIGRGVLGGAGGAGDLNFDVDFGVRCGSPYTLFGTPPTPHFM